MDKHELFNKFVAFSTSVHNTTNDITRNIKLSSITAVQYKMLEYLYVSQPVTPSEISECLHISLPNTSRELRKLDESKLIERVTDTEDRRKQSIRLSSSGQAAMNAAFAAIEQQFLARIEHLSKHDLIEIERAIALLQSKIFH